MKKVRSIHRYQTERAIIDALLKISKIMKKVISINPHPKKTSNDGDKNEYNVPIPPPMRTFKSHIMSSSNCNQIPILLRNSRLNRQKSNKRQRNKYQYRTSFDNDEYSASDC